MKGSYMKQLRLTKQLEQRAREAANVRKTAEQHIGDAQRQLSEARAMGAETADAERSLTEATHAFSNNEFQSALSKADDSLGTSSGSMTARVSKVLDSARAIVKLGPEGVKDVKVDITEAERLMGEGDLTGAHAVANRAWGRAEQCSNRMVADTMGVAQSLILMAESNGLSIDRGKRLLSSARDSMDQGDQVRALELLDRCVEAVRKEVVDHLDGGIEDIGPIRERIVALNGSTMRTDGMVSGSKDLATQGMVEEALDMLRKTRAVADGELAEALSDALSRMRTMADAMAADGEDVTDVIDLLDSVGPVTTTNLKDRERDYQDIVDALQSHERAHLARRILGLRSKLVLGDRVGLDMSGPIRDLSRARALLNEGEFDRSLEVIEHVSEYLDDKLGGFEDVKRELRALEMLREIVTGIPMDPKAIDSLVDRARERSMALDFAGSISSLKEAQSLVRRRAEESLAGDIMQMEMELVKALRMSIDVCDESRRIDELIALVRGGDFAGARDSIMGSMERVRSMMRAEALGMITRVSNDLKVLRGESDLSDVEGLLERARGEFEAGDYERSHSISLEAMESYRNLLRATLNQRMSEAERLMEISKGLDSESVTLSHRLDDICSQEDVSSSLSKVSNIRDLLRNLVREELQRKLVRLSRDISAERRDGIVVTRPQGLLNEAEGALDEDDLETAYGRYMLTLETADETRIMYHRVYDRIVVTSRLLEQGRGMGKDIRDPLSMLSDAKHLFEDGRYVEADSESRAAYTQTESLMARAIAKDGIDRLGVLCSILSLEGIDDDGCANVVSDAERRLEMGDDRGALDVIKAELERADALVIDVLGSALASAESDLEHILDMGMDPGSSARILEKADSLLEDDDLQDAHRALSMARMEISHSMSVENEVHRSIRVSCSQLDAIGFLDIDLDGQRSLLRQAGEHAEHGSYTLSRELAHKAVEQAEELAEMDIVLRWRELIDGSKDVSGEDLDALLASTGDVPMMVSERRFVEAVAAIEFARDGMDDLRRVRSSVHESLEDVRGRLELLSEEGADVSAMTLTADAAERSSMEGALRGASMAVGSLMIDLAMAEIGFIEGSDRLAGLRHMVDEAEEGMGLSRANGFIEQAADRIAALDPAGASVMMDRAERWIARARTAWSIERDRRTMALEEALTILEQDAGCGPEDRLAELGARFTAAVDAHLGRVDVIADDPVATALLLRDALVEDSLGPRDWERFQGTVSKLDGALHRLNGMSMPIDTIRYDDAMHSVIRDPREAMDAASDALERAEAALDGLVPRIGLSVDAPVAMSSSEWTPVTVCVKNRSDAIARNLSLHIGETVDVHGDTEVRSLVGGAGRELRLEVRPRIVGNVSVELRVAFSPLLWEERLESFNDFRFRSS